jgi:acyl carrier protein phosphodiesterase
MNYLAHLFLAGPEPEALLGALMGDFVKGVLDQRYPAAVTRALALHRRIDTFTDAHPVTAASRARISPERRRFAGIIVDVSYDHFLARHWGEHAHEPLDAFTARVYALLEQHDALLPERLRLIAPRMAQADWLASYAQVESIHAALDRMSLRLKRENRLAGAGAELEANYAALEADFRAFFPDLVRFVQAQQRPQGTEGTESTEPASPAKPGT